MIVGLVQELKECNKWVQAITINSYQTYKTKTSRIYCFTKTSMITNRSQLKSKQASVNPKIKLCIRKPIVFRTSPFWRTRSKEQDLCIWIKTAWLWKKFWSSSWTLNQSFSIRPIIKVWIQQRLQTRWSWIVHHPRRADKSQILRLTSANLDRSQMFKSQQ